MLTDTKKINEYIANWWKADFSHVVFKQLPTRYSLITKKKRVIYEKLDRHSLNPAIRGNIFGDGAGQNNVVPVERQGPVIICAVLLRVHHLKLIRWRQVEGHSEVPPTPTLQAVERPWTSRRGWGAVQTKGDQADLVTEWMPRVTPVCCWGLHSGLWGWWGFVSGFIFCLDV